MGTSTRLAPLYDMQMQQRSITQASKTGPLQSLTDRELGLRAQPVTIYSRPYKKVRAWVRFGPESILVDAVLMRSTQLAAGVAFRADGEVFRCWVWGNAVTLADEACVSCAPAPQHRVAGCCQPITVVLRKPHPVWMLPVEDLVEGPVEEE